MLDFAALVKSGLMKGASQWVYCVLTNPRG